MVLRKKAKLWPDDQFGWQEHGRCFSWLLPRIGGGEIRDEELDASVISCEYS